MDCCTIIPMKVHCDKWNIDLPILVTYRYNDPANPYSAVFKAPSALSLKTASFQQMNNQRNTSG